MHQYGLWLALLVLSISSASRLPKVELKKFATSEERIRKHGYPAESYFVETSDGYLLNIFRIPYSHKLDNKGLKKPVILLQHGLVSNSDCWLCNGPDHSLAYLLADAGYDVWLGNARGNIYSRNNTNLSSDNPDFWRFSWHEISTIDLPALIDYILLKTGESALHYAAHSQGTTAYFVLMSEFPEYNKNIKSAHMLAPCAFLGHGTSFIFELLSPLIGTPGGIWNILLGNTELMPQNGKINRFIDSLCGTESFLDTKLCQNFYLWFADDGYKNVNQTALQILLETHPAGASTNQVIHYIQMYVSQEFRQFDYGKKKNEKIYNQATPPDYNISKITAPTYLYSSENDAICAPQDVDKLVSKLSQNVDDYRVPDPDFNHLDFIWAKNLRELINDRIIEICNRIEGVL